MIFGCQIEIEPQIYLCPIKIVGIDHVFVMQPIIQEFFSLRKSDFRSQLKIEFLCFRLLQSPTQLIVQNCQNCILVPIVA